MIEHNCVTQYSTEQLSQSSLILQTIIIAQTLSMERGMFSTNCTAVHKQKISKKVKVKYRIQLTTAEFSICITQFPVTFPELYLPVSIISNELL